MFNASALVIDDEPDIRNLIQYTLNKMGINVTLADSLNSSLLLLSNNHYDFCLTDMKLPDGSGLELVKKVQNDYPSMPIAVITAHGNMETAINALKNGAFDFVTKPIDLHTLRDLASSALKLAKEQPQVSEDSEFNLIGQSEVINKLKMTLVKVARSQAPVYISGPSGSGKELVARLIHQNSPRFDQGFIPVNCGAIPNDLMESEFFGHKKGSFTGAHTDKTGLFQAAHRGTLFLDEVADLPLEMQVKLLRAIQEKAIRPLGSPLEVSVDVRIISATHQNLSELVAKNLFRQDLFYRLNVIELLVPSLKERLDDIPLLVKYFIRKINPSPKQNIQLTQSALSRLKSYSFPGNVRELENILERAIALCDNYCIQADDLHLPQENNNNLKLEYDDTAHDLEDYLGQVEKEAICSALTQAAGNKTKAAQILGISFRALRYRLKKLGLSQGD